MRRHCLIGRFVLFLAIIAAAIPIEPLVAETPADAAATPKADESTKPVSKSEARRLALTEEKELLRLFADTLEQVKSKYVDAKVSDRELIEAAIEGMISKLDPYSNYIPPDELEQFRRGVERQYAGIGIQVAERAGSLQIVSPMFGTPAWHAGLRAGDRILKIGDKSTRGLSMNKSIELMTGKPGSTVTITVLHPDEQVAETVTLKREIIRMPTVLGYRRKPDGQWDYFYPTEKGDADQKTTADKIAYIRLTAFSPNTGKDLAEAIKKLQSDGMTSLILDLRFNPGGLLPEAIEVCDLFLRDGRIVSTEGRGVPNQSWDARAAGTLVPEGFPIAVIVNRFSASAAEIVSACLQDNQAAVVVGERTWGKGSVQNIILLGRQTSALKLTTASYQRPSGKNIHRAPGASESDDWGVRPDDGYAIKYTLADLNQLNDLFGRLDRIDQPNGKTAAVDEPPNEGEAPTGDKTPKEKAVAAAFVDRQLEKAVEYLQSRLASTSEKKTDDVTEEVAPAKGVTTSG